MINFTQDLVFHITSFLTIRECYVLGNTFKFIRDELIKNKVISQKKNDFIIPFYDKNSRIWSTKEGCFDWSIFIEMMKLNVGQQYINILINCNEKDVICWLKNLLPNSFIYKNREKSLKLDQQIHHECVSRIFKYHHQIVVQYFKINGNWKHIPFQDFNYPEGIQKIKISQQLITFQKICMFHNIVELNLKCCFINFENSYKECIFLNLKRLSLHTIRGNMNDFFLSCVSRQLQCLKLTNLILIDTIILEIMKPVKQLNLREIEFDSSHTKDMVLNQICQQMYTMNSLSLQSLSLFNNSLVTDEPELNRKDFKLKYLNLSNNLFSSLLHLSKHQCLQNLNYLNISKNCFNSISLNSLKFILSKTKFLEKIDLSSNFFNSSNFIEILNFISKNNQKLKSIICQSNFIIINNFMINCLKKMEFKLLDLRYNLVFGVFPFNIKIEWLIL